MKYSNVKESTPILTKTRTLQKLFSNLQEFYDRHSVRRRECQIALGGPQKNSTIDMRRIQKLAFEIRNSVSRLALVDDLSRELKSAGRPASAVRCRAAGWITLVAWFIGCVSMTLAYARMGVFVDTYNVLNACSAIYILVKIDAFMWSAYRLHCSTMRQAARRETTLERTRALEVALVEAEKVALETSSADLRALMGNVAHDLKTPVQSISVAVELLRSELNQIQTTMGTLRLTEKGIDSTAPVSVALDGPA
jgi:signal transduction histidine kinase